MTQTDIFLVKDFYLISGIAAFFIAAIITNYIAGNFGADGIYHWGFADQPVSHTDHLWNFFGMGLLGLAATQIGGCPLLNDFDVIGGAEGAIGNARVAPDHEHGAVLVAPHARSNRSREVRVLGVPRDSRIAGDEDHSRPRAYQVHRRARDRRLLTDLADMVPEHVVTAERRSEPGKKHH